MGRIVETKIENFGGGVTTDARNKDPRFARAIKHFDVLSSTEKMTPHTKLNADTFNSNLSTDASKARLVKFLTYGTSQSGTVQFALGKDGTGVLSTPTLYYRDAIPDSQWSGDSSTTGVINENLFFEYKGVAYAAIGGTAIISWTLDVSAPLGSSSVTNPARSLTYSDIFQGLVHSKDDVMYVPYLTTSGAFILKYNGTTWTDTALTLPTFVGKINICERGDYLAVGVQPKFLGGKSYVYLWDRDSSLATLSAKVDWGTENLELIEDLDGALVGISTLANSSINFSGSGKVIFKYWDGYSGSAKMLFELNTDDRAVVIGIQKQKENNRLYFMMSVKLSGAWHEGVWSIGKNERGQFCLALEYQFNNDTQLSGPGLKGFQILGNYLTVAYSDGGTYTVKVSDDTPTYTDTAIWESVIFNTGESSFKKDLVGISVMTEPLDDSPAGQVVAKYKKDNETSWTTIMTHDTDGAISDSAVNIESSGAALPKDYKEIQFRLESTGSAVITGFSFKEELTGKRNYD